MSKALLKEAREAIKNKDYKTSLKLCKNILRTEKENYVALVLLGVSLQEVGPKDQAPFAFRKAAQLSPTQPLAWQGLANYYEKETGESNKDLIEVYRQLLIIETDLKKYAEFCDKLVTVTLQHQNEVENVVKFLHEETLKEESTPEKCNIIWEHVALLLTQLTNVPTSLNTIYENALSSVVKCKSTVTIDYYKRYLKLLYKNKAFNRLITEAIAMNSVYSSEVYPLEWICKVYTELIIENNDLEINNEQIIIYVEKLLELNKESTMALLAKAVLLYGEEKYSECREVLNTLTSIRGSMHSWILMAKCNYKLYCFNEVEEAAEKALQLISNLNNSNSNLLKLCKTLLCEALSRQCLNVEKLENAVKICQEILQDSEPDFAVLISYARALMLLNRYEEAEKQLKIIKSSHDNHPDVYLIESIKLKQENKLDEVLKLLQSYEKRDNAEILLEIGDIHWIRKNYKESLMSYLEAAKLDPNRYLCFVKLGNYYLEINDKDKARRCYQKAFKTNPKCDVAGIGLSNIYREQKNWVENQLLLESVTVKGLDKRCKWAWIQLGVHYLEQGNYNEAINKLRSVIRLDPKDSHAWEALGDAYLARGAYTAAMKSFQRAAELNTDSLYPLLQSASIKHLIGQYTNSKEQYQLILRNNANYVPALKGLAETCLSMAKSKYHDQLIGCARDNIQLGIDSVTLALKQRTDLSCLWKILADCCHFAAKLPEKYCYVYVISSLITTESKNNLAIIHRMELFDLATRSYCKALNLSNSHALIWHDISSNYFTKSKYIEDKTEKKKLQERALIASKHCVTSKQQLWQHWNLLGIVAVELKQLKLAQHAFIKCILLDKNNAAAWTNLGTLYLMLGDLKLANEAFTNAQRSDPGYVQSWIGQALIAESLGHEDAMDLFRHCAQIGPEHAQGGLGYAHWVCSTLISVGPRANELYSIKNMHAIPVATDVIEWYTEKYPENACAWNMLGVLKERQKLHQSAEYAYKKSLEYIDSDHKDMVLTNLGQVLVKLGKYTEAIDYYKQVSEASFLSGVGLALAYFKAEMHEESYETYESALEWLAPDDNNKSHVLVAMSTMAYMFQGPDDAKTLLFQCIELDPPSIPGLFAACALGLLHGDIKLAHLVLKELNAYINDADYLSDIADLWTFNYIIQDEPTKAKSYLCHDVHKHPKEANLWLSLSRLLLRLDQSTDAASRCAQAAISLGRSIIDISKILCLVSLAEMLNGNFTKALRIAQKAVHSYPTVSEGWMLLISSFLPTCEKTRSYTKTEWLRLVINYVRRRTTTSRQMTQWLSNHERKVTLMADEYKL